ncbi:alpha/beta-hydrolase [Auricularia subglabra TFB-10046 SS5]|nr:alpha/beta-hydrolase [Auricularia subglabra TFB-10046 SS5]
MLFLAGLLLAAPAHGFVGGQGFGAAHKRDSAPFDWYALAPSDDITWTPCFDGQQCARLNLPLDHATPDGPKIQLALEMIAATDRENYQGTIIVNPGGPGGTGSEHMQAFGPRLASLFGPTFDILSFDPRGTGATTPRADCFAPEHLSAWYASEVVALHVNDTSIPHAMARDHLRGAACALAFGGKGSRDPRGSVEDWGAGRFMDTASVATDMLRIVEKLGQDKLQYYGITESQSYGTVLGQYFAAMYPDKVGRLIIDGVVDGVKWQRGQTWDMVEDSDPAMAEFFKDCALAGPGKCAIWEETPSAVADRFDSIFADLTENPISVPVPGGQPVLITADTVLALLWRNGLYFPLTGFNLIAMAARAIESRDLDTLAAIAGGGVDFASLPPWYRPTEAFVAISCSDFPPLNSSYTEAVRTVKKATALSRWGGPLVFTRLRLQCGAWKIRAKHRYTRPISAKLGVPALVLSNKYDPVTPLSAAKAVASRFGMGLLVQNAPGHCAFFYLSDCIASAMKAYMKDGILPEKGAICEPDAIPLVDAVSA